MFMDLFIGLSDYFDFQLVLRIENRSKPIEFWFLFNFILQNL